MPGDSLSQQIYCHLLACIHFGYYRTGEKLPTILQLCKMFGVSSITVRNALKELEQEGYISMGRGKRAIVIFEPDMKTQREQYITFCRSREDAVLDLEQAIISILPPLLVQGVQQCGDIDFYRLSQLTQRKGAKNLQICIDYFSYILRKLGNLLLLDLFQSISLFLHMMNTEGGWFHGRVREQFLALLQETLAEIAASRRKGNPQSLNLLLCNLCNAYMEYTRALIRSLPGEKPEEQVRYVWQAPARRPQMYFTIAMDILEDISQNCNGGDFIPSVSALAAQYGAPVITIRRAVALLGETGITETLNGKGTRVLTPYNRQNLTLDLNTPRIRQLSINYLQSLQIFSITCYRVVCSQFPGIPETARTELAKTLRSAFEMDNFSRALSDCLRLFAEHSVNNAVREIYGNLLKLLLLGGSLYPVATGGLADAKVKDSLLESLEQGQTALFADELQRSVCAAFSFSRNKLIDSGIIEAEDITVPQL